MTRRRSSSVRGRARWRGMRPGSMGPVRAYGTAARFRECLSREAGAAGPEQDADRAGRGAAGGRGEHPAVQRLQFSFLSESPWDPERVDARRLELLRADPATAPHDAGGLVIDDSGDRKDGTKTAHAGHHGWPVRQDRQRRGHRHHTVGGRTALLPGLPGACPRPRAPARHFAKGKSDPGFRTKLAIGADSGDQGQGRRVSCSARWPPTARTGTRTGSAASWPGCRS